MIIKDLYQTQIKCLVNNKECYEVDIDSSVSVMVSLIDFNGEAVTNKKFILTVDKGYFSSSNGRVTSIEGETNSNGVYSVAYVPSEFGLATFRVNDKSIKMKVHGRKHLLSATGEKNSIHFYDYGKYASLEFNGYVLECDKHWKVELADSILDENLVDSDYAPKEMVSGVVFNVPKDNSIEVHTNSSKLPLWALGVRFNESTNNIEVLKKLLNGTTGENGRCDGRLVLFWNKGI